MSWKENIEWKQLVNKETGEIYKERWPYFNDIKAISPSTLLAPLFSLVYGITPPNFTHSGMTDGIEFENALAHYMKTKNIGVSTEMVSNDKLKPRFARLANILNNDRTHIDIDTPFLRNTIGCDIWANGMLIACESDMEFPNYILELKKTNTKGKSKLKLFALELAYELQCCMQWMVFQKPIYLVWAGDMGIKLKAINDVDSYRTMWMERLLELYASDEPLEQKIFELENEIKEKLNETNDRP